VGRVRTSRTSITAREIAVDKELNAVSFDQPTFSDDIVHESAKHALEQRRKYARWLDAEDPMAVANAMLVMIGSA
jgi:restriction system protein